MDIRKYRTIVLCHNHETNRFQMIKYNIERDVEQNRVFKTAYGINHPLVLSKKAFWINKDELCIGYKLDTNPEIYRPIFSHSRQRILDKVHNEEIDDDGNKNQNIRNPYKFWNKIKTKYFNTLYKKRELPTVCISRIIMFIN